MAEKENKLSKDIIIEPAKEVSKENIKKKEPVTAKKYIVSVIAFYELGKMFRGNSEIDGNQYKEYIDKWLEKGLIKPKK